MAQGCLHRGILAAAALFFASVVGFVGTPAVAQTLEVTQLVVKDAGGAARARLYVDGERTVTLEFYDGSKHRRAALSVGADGPTSLDFFDAAGASSVSLQALHPLGPALNLRQHEKTAWLGILSGGVSIATEAGQGDKKARTDLTTIPGASALSFESGQEKRIHLGWGIPDTRLSIYGHNAQGTAEIVVPDKGSPRVAVTKEQPQQVAAGPRASIGMFAAREPNASAMPGFALADKNGQARAVLVLRSDETPMLTLQAPDETPRAVVAMRPDGRPVIQLYDPKGVIRFAVGIGDNAEGAPILAFFDQGGNSIPPASAASGHWILWRQGILPGATLGAPVQQLTFALGAWSTREECEAQRGKQQPAPSGTVRVDTCLPDTVNLRDRR